MSVLVSLDEVPEAELIAELRARILRRARGLCDYCERIASTPPCRFPDRHSLLRKLNEAPSGETPAPGRSQ